MHIDQLQAHRRMRPLLKTKSSLLVSSLKGILSFPPFTYSLDLALDVGKHILTVNLEYIVVFVQFKLCFLIDLNKDVSNANCYRRLTEAALLCVTYSKLLERALHHDSNRHKLRCAGRTVFDLKGLTEHEMHTVLHLHQFEDIVVWYNFLMHLVHSA